MLKSSFDWYEDDVAMSEKSASQCELGALNGLWPQKVCENAWHTNTHGIVCQALANLASLLLEFNIARSETIFPRRRPSLATERRCTEHFGYFR